MFFCHNQSFRKSAYPSRRVHYGPNTVGDLAKSIPGSMNYSVKHVVTDPWVSYVRDEQGDDLL